MKFDEDLEDLEDLFEYDNATTHSDQYFLTGATDRVQMREEEWVSSFLGSEEELIDDILSHT